MHYQEDTFSIPKISVNGSFRINPGGLFKSVVSKSLPLVKNTSSYLFSVIRTLVSKLSTRFSGVGSRFNFKKFIPIGVFALFVLFTGYMLVKRIAPSLIGSSEIKVKGAKAEESLGKEYSYPLRDENGVEVGRFKFVVEKIELRDEIVVQGKRATTVSGRTFLIVNLKITNEFSQRIDINTKDFVRLSTNSDNNEWQAPEIHNDPVEVQAISTKFTRVGFAINDTDKDLTVRIGEINGEKEEIPLSLNK